jgi:hypothetical protein
MLDLHVDIERDLGVRNGLLALAFARIESATGWNACSR